MNRKVRLEDPDLRGVLPALRHAARAANRLAIQTGTSCYVMRAGKIADIAARPPVRKRSVRRKITKGTRP